MDELNIKLLTDTAKIPTRGSKFAAGYDIYADETVTIMPGGCVKVKTGIATSFPDKYFAAVYPRSGIATKQGLRLSNCVGVIDPDYRGEWLVSLYNDSGDPRTVFTGDRIAQFVIQPFEALPLVEVENLDESDRGAGGFGSTGTR